MKITKRLTFTPLPLLVAALTGLAAPADAALFNYYVGTDSLATIAAGEFAGQPNPNAGRMTLLYAHHNEITPASNHYHSKGIFRFQPGSGAAPIIELSPSNYLPEGSNPPLLMGASTGIYDGKLTAIQDPGNDFSMITIKGVDDLMGFGAGTGEEFLLNSSGGRWAGSLAGSDPHLVLVSLSEGLNIGNATSLSLGLFEAGDDYHLGENPDFSPVFWTEANAELGLYTAQFQLVDEEGLFGDSGTFELRFQVVPEPSSALLLGAAALLGLSRRRR